MKTIKDRHLDVPEEANRDKHINFLAEEEGDVDPSNEDAKEENVDNGFFTNDDDDAEEKESSDKKNVSSITSEKIIPVSADAAQSINDSSIPEGDNNSSALDPGKKVLNNDDDQAH